MQIFLKSIDGRAHTLDVEGSTTYEDIVYMLTNSDNIVLLTTNPKIIIGTEDRELTPGMKCEDINVRLESEGRFIDPRPRPEHAIPRTPGPWVDVLPLSRQLTYSNIRVLDEQRKKNEAIREKDEVIRGKDEVIRGKDEVIHQLRTHIAETETINFQEQLTASRKKAYEARQQRRRLNEDYLGGGYRKRSKTRRINRKGRRRKSSRR